MLEHTTNVWVLLALLTALGFRHGLDPDHIAAVDGMTRHRYSQPAYWSARFTGLQFALGHSMMILLAALIFHWQGVHLPAWLDAAGSWISCAFLLVLAIMNLQHCFSGHGHHHPVSMTQQLIQRWLGRFAHPVAVGFIFAISLDSLAQAALMATQGNAWGGLGMIVTMSLFFGLGMMLADTSNGLVMHWLVTRSEGLAKNAARIMSGLIAALSLAVVMASVSRRQLPGLDQLLDDWAAWLGLSITGILILTYLMLRRKVSHSPLALPLVSGSV
jgi:high-affinity nickel-transport protein